MTEKQKSTVRLITVLGIILAVIMAIALVYNLVTLGNLSAKKSELEAKIAEYESVVAENDELIDYRGSDDYIERYARDYLNMIWKNDIANKSEE